ncbi:TonB family protein [Larkinella insperata]|uniref:TonB family protein n=1 Tax=Larkinella insperata TaxID=332158 RepID=A0ABW3QJY8_9BACT|nr:TonB family protein [Larkinella insperata]
MKHVLCVLFLLITAFSASAQTIYKDYEVDSAARPVGGLPLLEKFIAANRRMPYAAEVERTKGIVIVSAVVEPNGTVSEVKTIRSLRPDCDREAVRVVGAFHAWKPALKDGQPVRQSFTYPIRFAPTLNQQSEPGAITTYFSKEGNQIGEEAQAAFKLTTPVDTAGLPNGNPVLSKREGSKWQRAVENKFEKKPFVHSNTDDPSLQDSLQGYQLVIKDPIFQSWNGVIYSLYPDGTLMARQHFVDGKEVGESVYYYKNGLVKRLEERLQEGKTQEWAWYPNGQMQQILVRTTTVAKPEEMELLAQWDAKGNPLVKNGNGTARFRSKHNHQWVTETGTIKEGRKEGIWYGRLDNGSLSYRETYQQGECSSGVAYYDTDSVTYKNAWQNPEFKGGMQGLGNFLSTNIHYPEEAARANIEGKVFVSFVVCEDGSLCDYEVLRSVHPVVDREALRVVKASNGKWKPGSIRGRKVRVKYNLPLNFQLQ